MLTAVIFDVDGVLLASPHERAWREALDGITEPSRFTTAMYQAYVAGKPRLAGATAALEALGLPDAERLAKPYAERKQLRLEQLIEEGAFSAFPDALRLADAILALKWKLAAASSSRNANDMMRAVHLPSGLNLLEAFTANVCGRPVPHGKPAPDLFLLAARELGRASSACLVVEDAPAGVEAARAGGMAAIGVARLHDAQLLQQAGADLVVTSLDQVDTDELAGGRLCRRRS